MNFRQPALMIFFQVTVFIIVIQLQLVHWGWLDDPAFDLAINGALGAQMTNCYLIGDGYHFLLSPFFALLYKSLPGFGWNAFISGLLLLISTIALTHSLNGFYRKTAWITYLISILTFCWLVSSYTFISLSIISGTAGTLYIASSIKRNTCINSRLLAGLLLVIISLQTRLQGAYIGLCAASIFIFCLPQRAQIHSVLIKTISLFSLMALPFFIAIYHNGSPEAASIQKIDRLLRTQNNFGWHCNLPAYTDTAASNEFNLALKHWYVADAEKFVQHSVNLICDKASTENILLWLHSKFENLIYDLTNNHEGFNVFNIPVVLCSLCLFIFVALIQLYAGIISPARLIVLLLFILLIFFVGILFYLPLRVSQPMIAILMIFSASTTDWLRKNKKKQTSILSSVLLISWLIILIKINQNQYHVRARSIDKVSQLLYETNPNSVIWTDSEGITLLHPDPLYFKKPSQKIYIDSYTFLYLKKYHNVWKEITAEKTYLKQISYLLQSGLLCYLGNEENYSFKRSYIHRNAGLSCHLSKSKSISKDYYYMSYKTHLILSEIQFE